MANKVTRTAPRMIYLQVSDDPDDVRETFPAPSEDMTWCADSVLACEVTYLRADLADKTEAGRLAEICRDVHDRILRGDSDRELMEKLAAAWDMPPNA